MSISDGGKGSSPRPYSVDADTFASNWDRIFRRQVPTENDLAQQALELPPVKTYAGGRRNYCSRIDPVRQDEYNTGLDAVDGDDDDVLA